MIKLKSNFDVFKHSRISESQIINDANIELAVLGGLDIFTSKHVQGVVKNVLKMCIKMNYQYDYTKKCVTGAYLHDIGKIMIPHEVLQKRGTLDANEYEIMKKHTIYGYEICMKIPKCVQYANIVRAHHENEDGTGYPDGLNKKTIPEEAKLIKVADVYDALTQKRQYKEGLKRSIALRMMLNDVKSKKMASNYFEALLMVVLDDLNEELYSHTLCIEKYSSDLEILKELEKIYKEIYDKGLTTKLEKKLSKFELEPGYDMSTNINLKVLKQKKLEEEKALQKEIVDEIGEVNKVIKEFYKRRII